MHDPLPSKQEKIKEALSNNKVLLLVGSCDIEFRGRARSTLAKGERIVLIKPDGTLLVHKKEGHKPVNWNPPGSHQHVKANADSVKIISTRENPKEKVVITFHKIKELASFDLKDYHDLQLEGTQDQMVGRVIDNPDLIESGFQPKQAEKATGEGDVDLYGVDSTGTPVACEFKRRKAEKGDASQLHRYVEALERNHQEVRGFLVAPGITKGAQEYLDRKNMEFSKVSPLKGISVTSTKQKKLDKFDVFPKNESKSCQ